MIDHLQGQRGLDELAANPLLLTGMCIIYAEGRRLPEDKYELYDRIVDTVLYKRYPVIQLVTEVRARLAAIALGMHTGEGLRQERENPEASGSDREIDLLLQEYHKLDGATDKGLHDTVAVREDLLSRSGLLVSRGDARAAFYHLSFQEFLATDQLFVRHWRQPDGFRDLMLERGPAAGWRNTLSFLFGCLVKKINPKAGVELLQDMVSGIRLPEADQSQQGATGGVWNLAIVLGDCLEILIGRKVELPRKLCEFFEKVVTQAIAQEIAVKERHTLAVALGRLGDPRIVTDLQSCRPS